MDIRARIKEALEQGHLMSLGTCDASGVWVADVIYVYDDMFNIYWMSDPDTRHSKAIALNSKAAGSITISNKSKEANFGIQFEGLVEKVEGAGYDLAIKHLLKRGHEAPKETDDVLQGDSWYCLRPTKIQLIDEKNFGFNKQVIEL